MSCAFRMFSCRKKSVRLLNFGVSLLADPGTAIFFGQQILMEHARDLCGRLGPTISLGGSFQRECRRLIVARRRHEEMAAYPNINPITRPTYVDLGPRAAPAPRETSAARYVLPGTSAEQRRKRILLCSPAGKWCGQALMEWSLPAVGTTGKRPIIVSRICGVKQRAKLKTSAGVTDARGGR
jgi:hypothetical protein